MVQPQGKPHPISILPGLLPYPQLPPVLSTNSGAGRWPSAEPLVALPRSWQHQCPQQLQEQRAGSDLWWPLQSGMPTPCLAYLHCHCVTVSSKIHVCLLPCGSRRQNNYLSKTVLYALQGKSIQEVSKVGRCPEALGRSPGRSNEDSLKLSCLGAGRVTGAGGRADRRSVWASVWPPASPNNTQHCSFHFSL